MSLTKVIDPGYYLQDETVVIVILEHSWWSASPSDVAGKYIDSGHIY